jgi:hypothetical protein
VILRQRLNAIADPDLAVREHVGPQSAPVHEAAQHSWPRQPFEVGARLAPTLAQALDPSDPKAPSDEVIERDVPHDEVAPRFDGR